MAEQLHAKPAADGKPDLFAAQAALYARARPTYPASLLEVVLAKVEGRDTCCDVGCGSGQLTAELASHFEAVHGVDRSERQLQQASALENVTYAVGTAAALPAAIGTHSCDLVSVAQMYHWLLQEGSDASFLREARRVLKPGTGKLAVLGYGICSIAGCPPMEAAFKHYYFQTLGSDKAPGAPGCLWDVDRRLLDNGLEGTCFPDFRILSRETVVDKRRLPLRIFCQYLETFSAYQTLKAGLDAGAEDPLKKLVSELETLAGTAEAEVEVDYPFFAILLEAQ